MFVLLGKCRQIKLVALLLPLFVRNLKEGVDFLIDIFDIIQRRISGLENLPQPFEVGTVPYQQRIGFLAVATGTARLLKIGLR